MLLNRAHPTMDTAILFLLLGVKGYDIRKIASFSIGLLQNLLARRIDFTGELVQDFLVCRLPGPMCFQEVNCCRFQAGEGLRPGWSILSLRIVKPLMVTPYLAGHTTDSRAPTPEKLEEKVHRHLRRRFTNQSFPNLLLTLDKKRCGHWYASSKDLNPQGWSLEPARTVVLG